MKKTFARWSLVLTLILGPSAALASATSVADVLGVSGNRGVTRAEFLKASVILLKLDVDFDAPPKQYRAYGKDIQPYARAAGDAGALDAFGSTADLSQVITRGEAVRLVAELRSWKGTGAVLPFRDVDPSTELGAAVKIAAQRGWISPMRKNVFGVHAPLRAKEARTFLTRATTDAGEREQPKTVKVVLPKKEPIGYASKKFRDQVQNLLRDEYLYAEKLKTATGSTAREYVDSMKDPYTTLFDPVESKAFQDQLSGTLSGIGVHLDENRFEVIAVIKGSPAERAGIKQGDRIVSVNKKRVEGTPFADVIKRIRGREGTPVRVGVSRGNEELAFDIIRAKIDIPDTEIETRSGVAIVKISQFGDHLIKDAEGLFEGIAASQPVGIVLDLRSNPGGYLQAVPSVLNAFLPDGSVYLYTRGKSFRDEYVTRGAPVIPAGIPVVVLTNGASASSAEIVAGALQDHGRATIVGTKTYGKGTVQTVIPFQNKSSLKFTIAEWLTPDGHPIDSVGITPDIEVEQSDAGDAQLEKALELIRQRSR